MRVVAHQLRVELVGLPRQEPVEAFEPATQRPLVERPRSRDVSAGHQVPLACTQRGIPLVPKDFGNRGRRIRDVAGRMREPRHPARQASHPDRMLGPTGQQCRACRRTHRRHVEVRELHPTGRQPIDVRRVDIGPVATKLREPGVVEQHEHDVRCTVTGVRPFLEMRLGIGQRAPDRSFEFCHVCS